VTLYIFLNVSSLSSDLHDDIALNTEILDISMSSFLFPTWINSFSSGEQILYPWWIPASVVWDIRMLYGDDVDASKEVMKVCMKNDYFTVEMKTCLTCTFKCLPSFERSFWFIGMLFERLGVPL
jgi:hypothetical protein